MITDTQKWFAVGALALFAWVIYLISPILTPFLISALLAYLADPLTDRLQSWRLPRTLAVVIVFTVLSLLFLILGLLLVPLLERQIVALVQRVPLYLERLQQDVLPWIERRLGLERGLLDIGSLREAMSAHWREAGGWAANILASVSRSGMALLGWMINLALIPVVTFFLLRDWDVLIARLRALLPRHSEPTVTRLARECDTMLSAFFRGQLLVMFALGAIYSTGLWLIGLDLALLLGMISGLVSFVPYLGFIVGIFAAGFAILMQTQDPTQLLWVFAVYGVGQVIEGSVLTPVLVGDRIHLHPVAVIFAVMAGGQLFGFTGVLLALPVAAVLAVLLRYAHGRYVQSELYADRS